jgi:RNA-directed DNA polymerase
MTTTVTTNKPFHIEKKRVCEAYKAVRSNRGAAGVDGQTLEQFDEDLGGNLYKTWNRMSSGSYFPPPVRAVSIPKKNGSGERVLGVPTVGDRIAQMVVKQLIEADLDPIFLPDSYGYRPRKSALDAVGITRQRCWKYDWVLEFDIRGLFDNLPHDLLLKAVRKHVKCEWALLYIERWLTAPMVKDGMTIERTRGTPQGGVISPILSNLFLHYAFDLWMGRTHPDIPWCRYADDGLVHCRTEQGAQVLMADLQARLAACGLEMHPTKTKIVYCKDSNRKGNYPNVSFDFLGYCFRPRRAENARTKQVFLQLSPGGQPVGIGVHAGDGPGLGHSTTNPSVYGRHRPANQSAPSGLDRVLRTVYALGIGTYPAICQSDAAGLGYAEVQELEGSQDQGQAFSHAAGWGVPGLLRTLETR